MFTLLVRASERCSENVDEYNEDYEDSNDRIVPGN